MDFLGSIVSFVLDLLVFTNHWRFYIATVIGIVIAFILALNGAEDSSMVLPGLAVVAGIAWGIIWERRAG